ncbi:lysine-specific demethylase 8-like [Cimex lectularius]|uniref:JmjC domain-containing protein 5 n=1 Tax=Cimex lectularius TaxID=79782 RepID=A0A8I6SIK6_CIMLE|nr:lysine-specific demethylase 8-like [Cimex lectularius]XP_014254077.1 lysine-specific demethylase 8-like [Cimex lectularius]XP_024083172.1 lysine-specific demethylase 8-like [Cimex lectularius]XP_024083173.1 lysine-specific demethylase 8-like [Cimex lectularius]
MEKLNSIISQLKVFLKTDRLSQVRDALPDSLFLLEKGYNLVTTDNTTRYSLKLIESVIDISWEDLNIGHWSTVPENHRKLHALACFLKVIGLLQLAMQDDENTADNLKEAVRTADLGLILGCGFHDELSTAARLISSALFELESDSFDPEISKCTYSSNCDAFPGIKGEEICSLKLPSLQYFSEHHFYPQKPAILLDCISHWPAFGKWDNINYLKKVAGHRTVPIELGSSYTENDWGMRLTTLQEFIENHIIRKGDSVGYLAQHQLFNQVPELQNDICVPEYCCISDLEDGSYGVDTNAWFGPAGTVTPLHYDPKHNLFCQVVGSKRVLLYSPEDSENLYPHDATMLNNTAQVDPYSPNYDLFPKYRQAKAYECHLRPGEMLYIPPKWWHHIRSLDISFSVSFWWE